MHPVIHLCPDLTKSPCSLSTCIDRTTPIPRPAGIISNPNGHMPYLAM